MKINTTRLAVLFLSTACGFAAASTLNVSLTGQFSSSVTTTPLSAPGGAWDISFNVPSNPSAANTDLLGFDTSFSGFSYQLNGSNIATAPQSIRFSTTSNLGLFTLFFGPESGQDSNGNPIPEFSFQGKQAFSGTTNSPTIVPGTYTVASWIYSDASNYDSHNASGSFVTIAATAVPEPSGLAIFAIAGLGLLAISRPRRSASLQ